MDVSVLKIAASLTPLPNLKKAIWADLGPKIQSLDVSVNLKATDTDVCRYTIIISKV